MIAAPLKSNYSKHELFDYFIHLEKYIFTNKGWNCYKHCQKNIWWEFCKEYILYSSYYNSVFNCYGIESESGNDRKQRMKTYSHWMHMLHSNLSWRLWIITHWMHQWHIKLSTLWWETTAMGTRTKLVNRKIWVTIPLCWLGITIRYVLKIFVKLFRFWIICFITSHCFSSTKFHLKK